MKVTKTKTKLKHLKNMFRALTKLKLSSHSVTEILLRMLTISIRPAVKQKP